MRSTLKGSKHALFFNFFYYFIRFEYNIRKKNDVWFIRVNFDALCSKLDIAALKQAPDIHLQIYKTNKLTIIVMRWCLLQRINWRAFVVSQVSC